jgi:SAM-dependent methyltransferase
MDLKEYEILGAEIDSHWYYVAKGRAMRSFVKDSQVKEVLDVGAGSGVFARQLLSAGICRHAVCVDPAYTTEFMETNTTEKITFVRDMPSPSAELVLMMDVLEHVDDDAALLRQYTEHLGNDGQVLISVPAFEYLWSGHDVFLEHRRRYTRETLQATVDKAGLRVVRCRYFFGLLFPGVATARWLLSRRFAAGKTEAKSALREYPWLINQALILLHDVERATLFHINCSAGLTLFCLARRA